MSFINWTASNIVNKVEKDIAEEELRDKAQRERAAALSTPVRPAILHTRLEDVARRQCGSLSHADTVYRVDDYQQPDDYWFPESPYRRPTEPAADFLNESPRGNATLTYQDEHGELQAITELNLDIIGLRSPLIAAAFEESPSRSARLHLDLLTTMNAMPFLRFLYSGTYAEFEFYEDVPTSLLLHCQLYHLGAVYDLEELRKQALVNVHRQCEFGCSCPEKPIDLCAAISFAYEHLVDRASVMDAVINYCVARFCDHKLGEDDAFRKLAEDTRPFHLDLINTCRTRGFEDEAAMDIIQLPYNTKKPAYYASIDDTTNPRIRDVIRRLQQAERDEEGSNLSKHEGKQRAMPIHPPAASALTLALRQLTSGSEASRQETKDALQSEDEDSEFVKINSRRYSADTDASTRPLYKYTPSESDYVVLPGPAKVESADTGDMSETSTLVDVSCPATVPADLLAPTSSRPQASTRRTAIPRPESESEWELL